MAEYVITLPNPVPTITDDLAYDHGNIVVAFTVQQMVQTLELSTVARANTALNKGRNAWVIVNLYNVEIYRYRYDVATRKITIISPQPLDGDLEVYILGKESDWNGTDPLDVTITKNVIGNVVTLKRTSKIGPSTDAVVRPPWPNATFDSVDVDMFFEFGLDLPVWTLRPNWREGMTERLDWLTDVLSSTSGAEQRRMTRLSPRRSFEITINPTHRERSYADLFLHRMGAQEIFFPLWHDVGKLNAEAEIGSYFVSFDNTYREFVTGGYAILYKDAFTWELVEITDQDDDGITTLNPLQSTWPNRATIYPVRPARLTDDSNFSALTGRVGESQLLFTLSRENDYDDDAEFDFTYAGAPVLTTPPNRRDALDQSFQRLLASMDNDTGRQRVVDIAGRSFTTQIYNWMVNGREAHHKMRQLLYWLRGRQRMLWVPTFNDDVRLARTSNAASQLLDIEKIGYGYTGGAVAGRDRVFLKGATGYEIARVTATGAALAADEERLVLATGLTQQMTAGTYGSFVDAARLDQDSVEITHHTDSDGACEVSCAFRSFSNTRDPSGVIAHPVPEGIPNGFPCGSEIYTVTFDLPMNPMPPIKDEYNYLHGNVMIYGSLAGYGAFYAETVTEPRTNIAAGASYDAWRVITDGGGNEVYRYRYDPALNRVTFIAQALPTDFHYYSLGNRTEAGWTSGVSLIPVVRWNGIELAPTAQIGPQTDNNVFIGWPSTSGVFPPVDIDLEFV